MTIPTQPKLGQQIPPGPQMAAQDWSLLVVLSVLWGGSFLFVGIAVKELPPFTLVLARVAIAALILTVVVRAMGLQWPPLERLAPFIIMAVINNVIPFTLIVTGQTRISSGLASVINATTPIWVAILAHAFTTDEKLVANRLAGVLLGALGVAVLVGPDAIAGQRSSVLGMACVLAATLSYAAAGIWGKRLRGTPPVISASLQLVASTALMLPLALAFDRPWLLPAPSAATILAMLALSALSTALAYLIYFRILVRAGASNVLLVTLLIPVSGLLLGALCLDETIRAREVLGAAVIAAALIVIDGRVLGRKS